MIGEKQYIMTRDYCGAYSYRNGSIERIMMGNGFMQDSLYFVQIKDYQGNVRAVLDQNHNVVERNDYYPYGGLINNNRAYLDGMSHLITAKGKFNISRDELSITVNNQLPQWINESSTTSDINSADPTFATTTFGLNRFLQGIFDAFSAGNDTYGKIVISINS